MALESFQGPAVDLANALTHACCETRDEVVHEDGDVIDAFFQRWRMYRKHIQSVIQVRAETPLRDMALQIAVRRRNDPNVRLNGPVAADSFKFLFLKDAQERDLHFRRQFADFIEENRSAIRRLKPPDPLLQSAGERPLFVAEQLARDEFRRQRRTTDFDQSTPASRRPPVNAVRDKLLSTARLSGDQHGRVGRGHAINGSQYIPQRLRRADDFLEYGSLNNFVLQETILRLQLFLQRVDFFKCQCIRYRNRNDFGNNLKQLDLAAVEAALLERDEINCPQHLASPE